MTLYNGGMVALSEIVTMDLEPFWSGGPVLPNVPLMGP